MLSDKFPLEQFYRDARIHTIHEGTTGIQGLDLPGRTVTIKNGKAAVLLIQEIAYVRTTKRNQGIGGKLLSALQQQTRRPVLIGTWADAVWAVRFYEKYGFRMVTPEEKDRLLKKYWSIPERQVETSVVLADQRWFIMRGREL